MRRPLSSLVSARWPWLAMSALVCALAVGAMLFLQKREDEARTNESIAEAFAAKLPLGARSSTGDILTLIGVITREEPDLVDKIARRQLALLKSELAPIAAIDPAGAAEIRDALEASERSQGDVVAGGLMFAKAARVAERISTEQGETADRAERDSFIGSIGALAFATLLVGILLSRERRLTLRAARRHAEEIQRLADHDDLTGLLNRRRFDEALQALSMDDAEREVELVVCDVNGLKSINDRFGHHAGDAVLVTATQDLQSALGDHGTIYRTGGDEFSIIGRPGERIANLARQAFERDGVIVASVGAATWPTDSVIAREVVRLADNRMYDAKRAIDPAATIATRESV